MRAARWVIVIVLVSGATAAAQLTPTFNDQFIGNVPRDDGTGSVTLAVDIYKPTGVTTPTPVVLWIHGGGWQSGTYNSVPQFLAPLLQQGISIASARYRLSGEAIFSAQIHDVKGAIRFLRANASTYGLDARRIGAWGSSAGAHLAALLATSGGVASAEGTSGGNVAHSSRVLAAVDYFGPSDLLNMQLDVTNPPGSTINHDAPGSPESRLIGFAGPGQGIGVLRANQNNPNPPYPAKMALINLANPITHVDATDPAIFIAHGTSDTVVPLRQSTKLRDALASAGVPHLYTEVAGAGHGPLGAATESASRAFLVAELTRPFGDATRDGVVNLDDFNVLAAHFGQAGGWRQGDFTNDGVVSLDDFNLLAGNFGAGAGLPALGSFVPEPGHLSFAAVVILFAARGHARRAAVRLSCRSSDRPRHRHRVFIGEGGIAPRAAGRWTRRAG